MDQSEFSIPGATGKSNALVAVKSAVPFLPPSPPVSSCLFFLTPFLLRSERTLTTNQKGTDCSLYVEWRCALISPYAKMADMNIIFSSHSD